MLRRKYCKSKQYTILPGESQPIDLSFLQRARGFKGPYLWSFWVYCLANITVPAANEAQSYDLARAVDTLVLKDVDGERVNIGGDSWRIIEQSHDGQAHKDPSDVGPSTVDVVMVRRVDFNPQNAIRSNDFAIPVSDLVDSEMTIKASAGVADGGGFNWTLNSLKVEVEGEIVDERGKEAKARLIYRDQPIQLQDDEYAVNGFLRCMTAFSGAVGKNAGRTWGTARAIESQSLDYTSRRAFVMREQALRQRVYNPSEDEFAANTALPVFAPYMFQKMPHLPYLGDVHFKYDGANIATSDKPKMIFEIIGKSSDEALSRIFGVDARVVPSLMRENAYVKAADGEREPLDNWPDALAAVMPKKIANTPFKRAHRAAITRRK